MGIFHTYVASYGPKLGVFFPLRSKLSIDLKKMEFLYIALVFYDTATSFLNLYKILLPSTCQVQSVQTRVKSEQNIARTRTSIR